ncbi:MAG: N-acetyl-gamma-glutamyl-phosphate reductase [Bryobacterales bacterium]|nr:N-acetyl-gamma-glutamyl-phosphate reductase [Bryobacterales bacterium]
MAIPVGIVGFRGYSGLELQRILERHPHVEPVLLEHRHDAAEGARPRGARPVRRVNCAPGPIVEAGIPLVFLATPQEVSLELTPALIEAGLKVVDLSGAFRLRTEENYTRWYKEPHGQGALMAEAVYGLPEFYRDKVPAARLLSNPGCYPTAASLALRPLVAAGLVDRQAGVVCDAKSGVSGAGRKPSLRTHFCEVSENFLAYSVLEHRHVPEVLMNSGLREAEFSFTAQLIPIHRGILETIYFRLSRPASAADIVACYESAYSGEPFVRVYDPGKFPDVHGVARTNFCDLGASVSGNRAVVVSVIDNLVKGAAGQAVQNMNLMLGFAETEGLL